MTDAEGTVAIRLAGPADDAELRRLAALDGARPLVGAVLVAEVDGELRAARSLGDERTISDPFRRTQALRALLELRARQLLEPAPAPRPRRSPRSAYRAA